MNKSVYLRLLFLTFLNTFNVAFAENSLDAQNPKKERFCNPSENSQIMVQLESLEKKRLSLAANDPKNFEVMDKISKVSSKLKCSYRDKQ